MILDQPTKKRLLAAVATAVIANAEHLTALDSAIGDGDHGANMARGFEAVLADIDAITAKPLPEALITIGTLMVMKIGGASGPLYGTLIMQLGKALPSAGPSDAEALAALATAIAAVKARGKSDVGAKTLLDVLAPVLAALEGGLADPARELPPIALAAAEATAPMLAVRGRASFLGDRSIGHIDPGARSMALIIEALCVAWRSPA